MTAPTQTIVVLAAASDRDAAEFAQARAVDGVRLMTPADLSRAGWNVRLGIEDGRTVVAGEVIDTASITAVVVRLAQIGEPDLYSAIASEDRAYAASEMTAFLAAWLAGLGPRALNSPSAVYLAGRVPTGRAVRAYAATAGVPIADEPSDAVAISCVDGRPLSDSGPVADAAKAVVAAAGERLARVHLAIGPDGPALAGYDHWIDLSDARVTDALMEACR